MFVMVEVEIGGIFVFDICVFISVGIIFFIGIFDFDDMSVKIGKCLGVGGIGDDVCEVDD